MTRRLTADRQGQAAPVRSIRLTEALAADIERVRVELTAAVPVGLAVSPSDAVRVLLGEALAARRAATFSPPPEQSVRSSSERPCDRCGGGLWHACTRHCGRRTRTCVCEASVAADGVCAACVNLAVPPPKAHTVKRIAADEVQESARAEVRVWLSADEARTKTSIAAAVGAPRANVLRWLAPGVLQRLPTDTINAILAHIRANP